MVMVRVRHGAAGQSPACGYPDLARVRFHQVQRGIDLHDGHDQDGVSRWAASRGLRRWKKPAWSPWSGTRGEAGRDHPHGIASAWGITTMTETAITMLVPMKYLTTAKAAVYLGYKSPSAVRTLKMRGLLRPDGRRGAQWPGHVPHHDA